MDEDIPSINGYDPPRFLQPYGSGRAVRSIQGNDIIDPVLQQAGMRHPEVLDSQPSRHILGGLQEIRGNFGLAEDVLDRHYIQPINAYDDLSTFAGRGEDDRGIPTDRQVTAV
jgi:hypothetical protein